MSRLKIIIPPEKKYLCSMLYEKFPLFSVDMSRFDGPTTFIATLLPDHDYTKDIAWCTRCGLQVYTEQQEREQLIRAFLKETVIEKMPVTNIRFLGNDHTLPGFFKVLVNPFRFCRDYASFSTGLDAKFIIMYDSSQMVVECMAHGTYKNIGSLLRLGTVPQTVSRVQVAPKSGSCIS